MIAKIKHFGRLCYRAAMSLGANHGNEMAGYLSFLALLSLFPYMVLMVSLMGIMGQGETGRHYIDLVLQHLPPEAVSSLAPRITEILSGPPGGLLTFSFFGALWTSSSAVDAIRGVLNRAFDVRKPPNYFWRRLWSIGQVLIFTLLVLSVMLLLVFTPIALNSFTEITGIRIPFEVEKFLSRYFVFVAGAALYALVASVYYYLPNLQHRWRNVLPGTLLVVVLWVTGASFVGFYFTHISQLTPIYGSLSGFIGTLIFFYVMILIFIYGAEFNHQLALARGVRIVEREHPEGVTLH